MKILYIASDTPMAGGATKSFIAMLRQAEAAGISFQVVCPNEKGLTKYLRSLGITVHVTDYRLAKLPQTLSFVDKLKWLPRLIHDYWLNTKAVNFIEKIARNFEADLIHENSSVIFVGYRAAKRLNIPDVIHIREYGDLDFNMTIPGITRRLSSPHTFTISITKDIARHRKQTDNYHSTQIYNPIIVPKSIRFNEFKKPYFLYAGRIESAKGVTELVDAYIKYTLKSCNPFPLHLAGGCNFPGYLHELMQKCTDAGMGELIIWLGERSDVADLMHETTATIIPSRFEGFGRVMPEAMANGSLCVARNTGGTAEQLENGRNLTDQDIAFSYDTDEELITILSEITDKTRKSTPFSADGEFRAMITRSQKTVIEYYSENKFGKELIGFYQRVLSPNANEA